MAEPEVTPEQLAEEIRRLKVSDLLVSTSSALAQLGYAKLDPATRDVEEARLAIETLRVLVPMLERAAGDQAARDFRQVVANLQLAYAAAVAAPAEEGSGPEAAS